MSASGESRTFLISVAAELAGVHPQTLRNYERYGLLDPSRTAGGSRRFSERDLERLRRIQELTSEGLNLEGVRRVLSLEAEIDALRSAIPALTELVSTLNDPEDYEMLGVCHLAIGNEGAASNMFREGLTLERARNPASDLCGRLMTRVAAI